jgi:hypothetical protein
MAPPFIVGGRRRVSRSEARFTFAAMGCAGLVGLGACGSGAATAPPAAPEAAPAVETSGVDGTESTSAAQVTPRVPDNARGGRLFDNWRAEKKLTASFVADSSKTPELDGKGGPNDNGTLGFGSGTALPNTGHDYRLKNFFGWDLRGESGVYGPEFQKKSYVLARDLLADTRSPAELRAWLTQGDERIPAFGQILDADDIDDLVAFIVATRTNELARPDHLFQLDASVPKNYRLSAGGDAARGRERYASTCANCHGNDGREIPIDETESLGTMARTSGYEVWFKILNGQPGTDMGRQVTESTGADQERAILDLLAALCDRQAFPALPSGKDVATGDARCGAYLR